MFNLHLHTDLHENTHKVTDIHWMYMCTDISSSSVVKIFKKALNSNPVKKKLKKSLIRTKDK